MLATLGCVTERSEKRSTVKFWSSRQVVQTRVCTERGVDRNLTVECVAEYSIAQPSVASMPMPTDMPSESAEQTAKGASVEQSYIQIHHHHRASILVTLSMTINGHPLTAMWETTDFWKFFNGHA